MSTDLILKGRSFTGCGKMRLWVELAFRPASEPFIFDSPGGLQSARNLLLTFIMTQHFFRALNIATILFLLAAFATGCSKPAPTAAWTLALKVNPDHPRMVRPATFTVHIADGTDAEINGARVTGSLNMTLMNMGKTEVTFEPQGHGDYAATLKSFDMSGPWELTVDASQGPIAAHKVFPVTIFD